MRRMRELLWFTLSEYKKIQKSPVCFRKGAWRGRCNKDFENVLKAGTWIPVSKKIDFQICY